MSQAIASAWYRGAAWLWLLWPLALLFGLVVRLRRALYRHGLLSAERFPVPVLVVGNITAGGTGKTPLTAALVRWLQAAGWRPAVVSRGYGGRADYPLRVRADMSPALCGDEPLALHRRCGVPVMVDPQRARAVAALLQDNACDIVLCDDGLQHYALARDVEIVVIDGARGLGNGQLLPAGPLREPPSRLAAVDFVVVNGDAAAWPLAHGMQLRPQPWQLLCADASAVAPVPPARLHAVAGIGNPARFFAALQVQGFDIVPHAFADHHAFTAGDLDFGDDLPVVMTEKDAVKCQAFARANWWQVPVEAELPEVFWQALATRLQTLRPH